MKKLTRTTLALCAALSLAALAPPAAAVSAEGGAPAPAAIGTTVADFTLPDAAGREHSLSKLKGKAGVALIFISTRCPVSNMYNGRMQQVADDYRARGVNVVGINSNAGEAAEEITSHAAEKGLKFTILKDAGAKIADRLGAARTPEVFLLDAAGKLVYHGAVDNAQNPVMVNTHHLRNALDAVVAGRAVERPEVKAFGCSIKRG
jgi:peroxiredoxin